MLASAASRTELCCALVIAGSGLVLLPIGCEREPAAISAASVQANAAQSSEAATVIDQGAADWLVRYGYLSEVSVKDASSISKAVRDMQSFNGLVVTGRVDGATSDAMQQFRCGLGDVGILWAVSCPWGSDTMRYAFDGITSDLNAELAKAAVRRAFDTYATVLAITFQEVSKANSPDVVVHWVTGSDSDFSFSSTDTAHADFPPECRRLKKETYSPLHFKDCEDCCHWTDASEGGRHDIESVALHEIGHLLGLKHSRFRDAVMFSELPIGSRKRVLHADDLQGLRELYPTRMR